MMSRAAQTVGRHRGIAGGDQTRMIVDRYALTHCPNCGYDIHLGLPYQRCPECALPLDDVSIIFRSKWPIRGLLRISAVPIAITILLFPFVGLVLGSALPVAIAKILITLIPIGLLTLFIWRAILARREALITSREGIAVGVRGRMRILGWSDILSVNLVDWPQYVKTSDGESITISQCFDHPVEVDVFRTIFGKIQQASRGDGETGSADTLGMEVANLARIRAPSKMRVLKWIAGIALVYVTCLLLLIAVRELAGARVEMIVRGLLFYAAIIYGLWRMWTSDKAGTKTGAESSDPHDEASA